MRQFIRLSPEAQAVAADLKQRGKTVNIGDPLPENLPRALAEEIRTNLGWFRLAWHLAHTQKDN
jgi:hypothetical protein